MVIFMMQMKQWIISFYSLTFFQNVACTGASSFFFSENKIKIISFLLDFGFFAVLIALKIWITNRNLERRGVRMDKQRPVQVVAVVIESGTVYSLVLITLMVVYLSNSWAQYPVLDAIVQIIVRISLYFSFLFRVSNPLLN